jgi:hypothetical protein
MSEERVVHVRKGQTVRVCCRKGVELVVQQFASGAVVVKNANTGSTMRAWAPKDRDQ